MHKMHWARREVLNFAHGGKCQERSTGEFVRNRDFKAKWHFGRQTSAFREVCV